MTTEAPVQQEIQVQAARVGCELLRNNSGVMINRAGQPVRFGLGNVSAKLNKVRKSPDLIGWTCRGLFIAVDAKPHGWRFNPNHDDEVAQLNFMEYVIRSGGIGCFATCWYDVYYRLHLYRQLP